MNPPELQIYTDGASRGNPGAAAYAFTIQLPGRPILEENGRLPDTTNNIAEYTALVKALDKAHQLGGKRLVVHSDSELMVKQMRGEYKVKHAGLLPLYKQATQAASKFDNVIYRHIRREYNKHADRLCNEALDGYPLVSAALADVPAGPEPAKKKFGPKGRAALEYLKGEVKKWAAGNANDPAPEDVLEKIISMLKG